MRIGNQLQKQRKLHKMSQDDLASKLHISRQSISKWENGGSLPSFANVIAISELFDISLDDLIKEDEALMNKFTSDDKIRLTKTETIFFTGFIIVFVILTFIYTKGITTASVDNLLSGFGVFFFIGFLCNIRWKEFNKSLNTWAVIFGILMIISIFVPYFMHEIPDFLKGLTEGINSQPYKY